MCTCLTPRCRPPSCQKGPLMFRDETSLDRFAAILVNASIAGAAASGLTLLPGAAEAMAGGAGLHVRLAGKRRIDAERVLAGFQRQFRAQWRTWSAISSRDEGRLESAVLSFEQVVPACGALPSEIVGLALDPDAIASRVLEIAESALPEVYANRDPRNADSHLARIFLLNVTRSAYAYLLAEPGYVDGLLPQIWPEVLGRTARIERNTDALVAQNDRNEAKLDELLAHFRRRESIEQVQAAQRAGISEERILGLARRIVADVPDLDTAFAELDRAVTVAIEVQNRGHAGSNTDDFVAAVLAHMAELSAEGRDTEAAAEADRAFAEWEEREEKRRLLETQKGIALLEAGLRADILRRDPASAARRLILKLELQAPEPAQFAASLRRERTTWFERGRDRGLRFDLDVSIELTREAVLRAHNADERGAALDNLGTALQELGARENDSVTLQKSIDAFRDALKECARERVPDEWARSQMHLAAAIRKLAERTGNLTRVEEAIAAYRAVLEVRTRHRVPEEWADTQLNLANALQTLGGIEGGTERLEEAVAAYRLSLEVWTRDRDPEAWGWVQVNLGNALRTLGVRKSGTEQLAEAVAALRTVPEVWTRDRMPFRWAIAQANLGSALHALGGRESGTKSLEDAVVALRAALEEFTPEDAAPHWAMTQMNLGNALLAIGEREEGTVRLVEAVRAYQAALRVYKRDKFPIDWARTQNNIGLVLTELGRREDDSEVIQEAVAAFRAALEIRTKEDFPRDWNTTQNNLSNALHALSESPERKEGIDSNNPTPSEHAQAMHVAVEDDKAETTRKLLEMMSSKAESTG